MSRIHGMENVVGAESIIAASIVDADALRKIPENADGIKAKAMELTDSWAGVMFALTPEELTTIAVAVGFSQNVAEKIHGKISALNYATTQGAQGRWSIATYHSLDVTLMALRGVESFDDALASFNDSNVRKVLDANQETFQRIKQSLPAHAARMNFKPETAAAVLAAFGAEVSPDLLYELATKYDTTSVIDLEGRRGVTVEFIRSVTLTLASTL
ncbi:hypothetical protein [Agrobacterium vitis]|uniref:Uncharacterized protein n=1 Tax=Agrobacterium vitis TaxID=373 RepID=A0AAE2UU33_AGRVI|nr:hypothetical protein [Agrobacterium vitis]MBF2714320.1 hypothetical protein [Agrobacterium vitis]MVA21982.1 hypothetical protein [Agrobacterium vitis]